MQPDMRSARRRQAGFTLIELLIVVAIIGIIAAIALPGLLSARRSGNQASAVASLRAIDSAQRTYSTSCAFGAFATALTQLGTVPATGGTAFIGPDLGLSDISTKSGYLVTVAGGTDGTAGRFDACNGVVSSDLASSFYATASPETPGGTGTLYYWVGMSGTIFQDTAAFAETNGFSTTPGGLPIQ